MRVERALVRHLRRWNHDKNKWDSVEHELRFQLSLAQRSSEADKRAYTRELAALEQSSQASIAHFQKELTSSQTIIADLQLRLVIEREASNAEVEKQVNGMKETLAAAEEESKRRALWNDAMVKEMANLKEETANKIKTMEANMQACYDECDKLRARLKDEIHNKARCGSRCTRVRSCARCSCHDESVGMPCGARVLCRCRRP